MKKCMILLLGIALLAVAGLFVARAYLVSTPIYKMYTVYQTVQQAEGGAADLQFTARQKALVGEIRGLLFDQGKALNDGGGDIFDAFLQEFKSERFNQPKMNSLAGKMVRRMYEVMPDLFDKIGQLHATLTPVQKEKILHMLGEAAP